MTQPLTPEQIAAAQSAFGSPVPAPATPAQQAGLVLPWQAAPVPSPLAGGLSPEQVAAAQSAFGPPAPPAPAATPRGVYGVPPSLARPPEPAPAPKAAASGAPSGPGRIGQLRQEVAAAQRGQLAAVDDQSAALRSQTEAEVTRQGVVGAAQSEEAARQERFAEHRRQAAAEASSKLESHAMQTQRMLDDLASERVDPNRIFANKDAGEKLTFILGGVLGGIQSGLQGRGGNDFIDMVEKIKAEDIMSQREAIDSKRQAIAGRNALYGQLSQMYGDRDMAEAAYGMALTQAAENRLKGMLASTESPIVQARGEQALAQLAASKEAEREKFAAAGLQRAEREAAAAASARAAAEQRQWERQKWLVETGLKADEIAAKRAEAEAKGGGISDADKARADYSKELEKAGIPQAETELATVRRLIQPGAKDVPGITGAKAWVLNKFGGELDKRILLSDEEKNTRNAIDRMADAYIKATTGAGGSPEEKAALKSHLLGLGSASELQAAIGQMEAAVRARRANLEAGYGPRVVGEYRANAAGTAAQPVAFRPGVRR